VKIGFDVSQTGKHKAGCGYFADCLIHHLAQIDSQNSYILYPTFGDSYWDPNWHNETCRISQQNFHFGLGHRTLRAVKLFWNHPPADFEAKLENPDIIHSNNFYCPRSLQNARLVYTLYDLSFLAHPEWTTEQNRTACFQGVFNASLYADLIISISHFSRNHFLEVFPHYSADRIIVIYPSSRFSPSRTAPPPRDLPPFLSGPFWLTVGTVEPRKNHRGLIEAYSLLKARHGSAYPLILAGGCGWLMADFEKELASLNLARDVKVLGYVDDSMLQWLYQNCFALVYPSLFEGFGLPVLEAMSQGAPVISSRVSSIPEIVGEAGILVDPSDTAGILNGMEKLLKDPGRRKELSDQSRRQSLNFSWKSAAASVLSAYGEVFSRPKIHAESPGRTAP
jgi:glycosyltransferase involved in cell wall biosynthesis